MNSKERSMKCNACADFIDPFLNFVGISKQPTSMSNNRSDL